MQAQGEKDADDNLIVGVYFIDINAETGLPLRYREQFRVKGPSIDTANVDKADPSANPSKGRA